jgi:hypothetical protein
MKFYKGLMLRVDDKQKEVRAVEIGACIGTHLHGTLFEPFLNPISGANV